MTALHTPCHTQDSICYFAEDGDDRAVFTGDTLFIGGCGRFFEGTPEQMHKALNETLAALPDTTKVFPGHEYTKGNVKFAKKVLNNDAIKRLDEYSQANKETQGKFTIGDEKVSFIPMLRLELVADRTSNIMCSCAWMIQSCRRLLAKPSPLTLWGPCGK